MVSNDSDPHGTDGNTVDIPLIVTITVLSLLVISGLAIVAVLIYLRKRNTTFEIVTDDGTDIFNEDEDDY